MRLYSFSVNKQAKVGVERNGKLVEVPVGSMIELIAAGKAGLTLANKTLKSKSAPTHDLKKAKLLAPFHDRARSAAAVSTTTVISRKTLAQPC